MNKKIKILGFVLTVAIMVGVTGQTAFAAGNYNIQALKLNTFNGKQNDTSVFANGVKNNVTGYTYTVNGKTTGITSKDFYSNSDYIKFWSSHGLESGELFGDNSGNDKIYIKTTNPQWAGGNLEFVFIAACNQLNGTAGTRPIYAQAMLGNKAVRVISGYHDDAPAKADAVIASKFIEYAKTGESVKSSWILANEYYKDNTDVSGYNARYYCVLTHSGNAQYSRIEGFPGNTYTRPGSSSTTILRFSAANPNGATELSTESLETMEVPNYMLKGNKREISVLSEETVVEGDTSQSKISVILDEIGDTPINMEDFAVRDMGLNWLDENVEGLNSNTLKNYDSEITPIVMASITEGIEGEEQTVAYVANVPNRYEGIKISGEGYDAVLDKDGVIATNMKWSDFEKIENNTKTKPIIFSEAKEILDNHFRLRTVDSQNVDDMNADISFVYSEEEDIYYPTWVFHGEEISYQVNCLTGEVK